MVRDWLEDGRVLWEMEVVSYVVEGMGHRNGVYERRPHMHRLQVKWLSCMYAQ